MNWKSPANGKCRIEKCIVRNGQTYVQMCWALLMVHRIPTTGAIHARYLGEVSYLHPGRDMTCDITVSPATLRQWQYSINSSHIIHSPYVRVSGESSLSLPHSRPHLNREFPIWKLILYGDSTVTYYVRNTPLSLTHEYPSHRIRAPTSSTSEFFIGSNGVAVMDDNFNFSLRAIRRVKCIMVSSMSFSDSSDHVMHGQMWISEWRRVE